MATLRDVQTSDTRLLQAINDQLASSSGEQLLDKGTVASGTVTFSVFRATKQKLTLSGALTVVFSDWAPAGTYSELEVQLVNGGLGVTWPTSVNWLKGDGTSTTTFASSGVTLQSPGTNWILVWSTDGGATVWGRAG